MHHILQQKNSKVLFRTQVSDDRCIHKHFKHTHLHARYSSICSMLVWKVEYTSLLPLEDKEIIGREEQWCIIPPCNLPYLLSGERLCTYAPCFFAMLLVKKSITAAAARWISGISVLLNAPHLRISEDDITVMAVMMCSLAVTLLKIFCFEPGVNHIPIYNPTPQEHVQCKSGFSRATRCAAPEHAGDICWRLLGQR